MDLQESWQADSKIYRENQKIINGPRFLKHDKVKVQLVYQIWGQCKATAEGRGTVTRTDETGERAEREASRRNSLSLWQGDGPRHRGRYGADECHDVTITIFTTQQCILCSS